MLRIHKLFVVFIFVEERNTYKLEFGVDLLFDVDVDYSNNALPYYKLKKLMPFQHKRKHIHT